ncbi:MAG: hypothetical protein V1909_01665 [Candidatus Micrarchaeota archaeon]
MTLIDMILRTEGGDLSTKMALLGAPLSACKETHVPPHEILALFDKRSEELLFEVGLKKVVEHSKRRVNIPALVEKWADQHEKMGTFIHLDSIGFMWMEMQERKLPLPAIFLAVIKARGLQDGINDIIDFFQERTIFKDSDAVFHMVLDDLLPRCSYSKYGTELRDLFRSGQVPMMKRTISEQGVSVLAEQMGRVQEPVSRLAKTELFKRVFSKTTTSEDTDEKRRILLGMLYAGFASDRDRLTRMLMDSEALSKQLVELAFQKRFGETEQASLVQEYLTFRGRNEVLSAGKTIPFDPSGLGSWIFPDALRKFAEKNGTEKTALVAMSVHRTTEGLTALFSEVVLGETNRKFMRQMEKTCPLETLGTAGRTAPSPPTMFFEHVLSRGKEPILHDGELRAAIISFLKD